jgi:large subunit ribosomal protein L9
MDVILQEDVDNLGQVGDVVRVRDGFARNYLLPRGLAVAADSRNLRVLEHQRRVAAQRLERQRKAGQSLAQRLAAVTVRIAARAGEEGRLFGSVTNMDIERLLREQGFSVERRRILLEDPIKSVGTYTVTVQVARDLETAITVVVEPEGDT